MTQVLFARPIDGAHRPPTRRSPGNQPRGYPDELVSQLRDSAPPATDWGAKQRIARR